MTINVPNLLFHGESAATTACHTCNRSSAIRTLETRSCRFDLILVAVFASLHAPLNRMEKNYLTWYQCSTPVHAARLCRFDSIHTTRASAGHGQPTQRGAGTSSVTGRAARHSHISLARPGSLYVASLWPPSRRGSRRCMSQRLLLCFACHTTTTTACLGQRG